MGTAKEQVPTKSASVAKHLGLTLMRTKIYRQREYIGDLLSLEDRAELIEQAHREAKSVVYRVAFASNSRVRKAPVSTSCRAMNPATSHELKLSIPLIPQR